MTPLLIGESVNTEFPSGLLPSLREMRFVCPKCHGSLAIIKLGYQCVECDETYSLHAGIPDFRVFPDPFLTYDEDYARTEIVLAALDKLKFKDLLEYYWSYSDITPASLRPKFVRSAILGETRARQAINLLKKEANNLDGKILEIGSGTGNFLAVAAASGYEVVGIDVAMRWLHLSRRRFLDAGLSVPPLVCCNAEFLPFADNSFCATISSSTLEFVSDQTQVLRECRRVLDGNGIFYINSVNRFSIAKDPYAYLWGVGFLPRKWQASYVKWRRAASYENVKTLSYGEFKRLAKQSFAVKKFFLPSISAVALKDLPIGMRLQLRIYNFFKKLSPLAFLLLHFGPGWDVILEKKSLEKS